MVFTPLFLPVANMLRCGIKGKAYVRVAAMRLAHGLESPPEFPNAGEGVESDALHFAGCQQADVLLGDADQIGQCARSHFAPGRHHIKALDDVRQAKLSNLALASRITQPMTCNSRPARAGPIIAPSMPMDRAFAPFGPHQSGGGARFDAFAAGCPDRRNFSETKYLQRLPLAMAPGEGYAPALRRR